MVSGERTGERGFLLDGGKYVLWAAVGALCGFGLAGILTIGAVFLALGVVLAAVGLFFPAFRDRSALAVLGGLAAAPLYLAWLNRGGPGTVCQSSDAETACVDEWSPWPFVGVALVLVVVCVVALRRARPHA